MLNNIFIAAALTFAVYFLVEFYKSVRQFLIFNRIRQSLLVSTFNYLKKTPQRMVDLNSLRALLLEKLKDQKMAMWVDDIKISWHTMDAIQFVFIFKFEKLRPKYRFVIGLKDVEDMMKRM